MFYVGALWIFLGFFFLSQRARVRSEFKKRCVILSKRRSYFAKKWMQIASQYPDRKALVVTQWGASLLAADQTASRDWFWKESQLLVERYEGSFAAAVRDWLANSPTVPPALQKEWLEDGRNFSLKKI